MVPEISLEELEEPLLTTSSTNDSAIAVESEVRNVFCQFLKVTVVSNTRNKNGKKLRNFFIREFPIESIGKCRSVGICYNHYWNINNSLGIYYSCCCKFQ